jgi:hypothetical protein
MNEDLPKYERFLAESGIGIGAIEYAKDASGKRYVYDVNTNTNYNNGAELRAGGDLQGMRRIVEYLTPLGS